MSFEGELLAILPRLRRFAASLSRDRADGDDLCQAALERGLKARDQWQPGTRLDSWMYRIMRNLWIDEARSRQRAAKTFAPEEAGLTVGHAGDRDIEAHMELSDVDRAMQALPDEQREAIALVLVEGLSYKEAAQLLGIPMGTLTSRLVRGRGALLELMGEAA
ncbi:RNA polymerase sigma factor [Sphingobium sp.]|uniref:RNA polymerase sigma factor n=1 Tax=Sphingobium sp. TaxID=1912891 RepID=UPI00261B8D25|nr:RNA polymerase sigma factor [Sphingobium sp.]